MRWAQACSQPSDQGAPARLGMVHPEDGLRGHLRDGHDLLDIYIKPQLNMKFVHAAAGERRRGDVGNKAASVGAPSVPTVPLTTLVLTVGG